MRVNKKKMPSSLGREEGDLAELCVCEPAFQSPPKDRQDCNHLRRREWAVQAKMVGPDVRRQAGRGGAVRPKG